MKKLLLLIFMAAVAVAAVTLSYFCGLNSCLNITPAPMAKLPASFEECAAQGFPIMESYPRQCRAGGVTFTEKLPEPVKTDKVMVTTPLPNELVASPLVVKGQARGPWYFEASFPAAVVDANGQELARVPAQAQAEWMTTEFVPFEVTLIFNQPTTPTGTLVLHKDNPSGDPAFDESVSVPIKFSTTTP